MAMIVGAVLLASIAWALTFALPGGNFWVKIGLSVIAVTLYSLYWQRPVLRFNAKSISFGVLSAALLYVIFFVGNKLAPLIIPGAHSEVKAIYDLGRDTNRFLIFLLLLFVTGPGEEIFWRSFFQASLMKRYGDVGGYLISSSVYAGVHIFSGSLVLVGAAFVAGAFWGALYLWKRDLGMVIVSHSLWSAFIFAVLPIR
ncbi:MAG: CPBP family intramembrane metalloprotease [Syntrophales bacterium]|nr:CPBP family intramembrane metalloprotease [Syntrophales bacterium]